ncbi:MAG: Gfo/Idh/MocA family oxidoreductase [Atribacterota bacterium]
MERIGIGIAGFGFIGRVHALAFTSVPFYYGELPFLPEIRGICTSRDETARRAQEETGISFVTPSLDELCSSDDIDVMVVALPNAFHRRAVEKAAQYHKAIYCDKPLAMNLAEAKDIRAIILDHHLIFGMSFQNRFAPPILRAKQLIGEGFLGEVYRIRATYLHSGYGDPQRPMSWRLRKDLAGGGALYDLGSHGVDLIRFLLGEMRVVSARGKTFIPERPVSVNSNKREAVLVDDWSQVDFELRSGAPGTLETSRFATGSCDELRLEIEGQKGALRYHSLQPNYLEVYDSTRNSGPYGGDRGFQFIETVQQYPAPNKIPGKFAVGWDRFHIASAHDFLLRLAGKESIGATIDDGVKVQEFLETAYQLMGY